MNQPIKFLEPPQLAALLNCPNTKRTSGIRDRAMLAVMFSTGLRVSELVGLDEDDLRGQRITVKGKRGKHRLVMLSDVARERLQPWLQYRFEHDCSNPALFTTLNFSRRIAIRTVQFLVKRYAEWVGLEGVHCHTLRHSFAVDALRNGADIRHVQQLLGHASIATTQIYLTLSDKMVEDAHTKYHNGSEVYAQL